MSLEIFTLAVLFTLTVLAYCRYQDPLYPGFLQAALWTFVVAVYLLNERYFLPLSGLICFILIEGVLGYSLGCYLTTYRYAVQRSRIEFVDRGTNRLREFLFWTSVLGLPLFIHHAIVLASKGPTGILLIDLRLVLSGKKAIGFGPLIYLAPISFVCAAIQVAFLQRSILQRAKTFVSIGVAITYSFFLTGRTFIFLLIILIFGVALITRRLQIRKALPWLLAGTLFVFGAMAVVLNKGTGEEKSIASSLPALGRNLRSYLLGGLPAFDNFLHYSSRPPTLGENTFRTGLALTNKLGFDTPPPPLVQKYTKVPAPTNVYTVYQPYFEDFSYLGLVSIQFLFGLWQGFLYRKADGGSPLFVCLYAVFLYPLAMQFFDFPAQWDPKLGIHVT